MIALAEAKPLRRVERIYIRKRLLEAKRDLDAARRTLAIAGWDDDARNLTVVLHTVIALRDKIEPTEGTAP